MTARRWALIRTITGAGPLTIREIARRVHRDVKPCTAMCMRCLILVSSTKITAWSFSLTMLSMLMSYCVQPRSIL